LRHEFSLEGLTGCLASEDPNQHAQGLDAVLALTTISSSASKPSLHLVSRPDHNATAPAQS
jgi:hypothetical protein